MMRFFNFKELQMREQLADAIESQYPYLRSQAQLCHPEDVQAVSRRQLLKYGASLSALMTAQQFALPIKSLAQSASTSSSVARRLVWIMMDGGWDILETTDPKVASTSGIDMIYPWSDAMQISGAQDGQKIGRSFVRTAGLGSDLLVVNGLSMGTTSHTAGAVYMDTGVLSNSGMVNVASIPAIVASQSGSTIPLIQLQGGMDVNTDRATSNVSVVRAQNLDLYRSMYPETSSDLEQKMKILDHLKNSVERLETISGTNDRANAVKEAESKIRVQFENDVRSKLDLSPEDITPFTVNAPPGLNTAQRDSFAMALKLLKNDLVTCVNMGVGGFDTHSGQEARLTPVLNSFDYLLAKFVNELKAAGQLDNTLIVVISDFGRTPKINRTNGRDHWPVGGAMMLGGGIDGARVVGASDDNLRALSINTTTGLVDSSGEQISAKHLGGSVVSLCLGQTFFDEKRSGYLYSIPALTRIRT